MGGKAVGRRVFEAGPRGAAAGSRPVCRQKVRVWLLGGGPARAEGKPATNYYSAI